MNLKKIFEENLKKAGGEILETIPNDWHEVKAKFAIAENGAVWIEEYKKELFLSEKVAVVLNENEIYEKITDIMDKIESPGVFVSGPSKTADVESFLVFGAHGPVRLGVYLTKN
jgi:L-lactate dehydrogenase complex protein LldG